MEIVIYYTGSLELSSYAHACRAQVNMNAV